MSDAGFDDYDEQNEEDGSWEQHLERMTECLAVMDALTESSELAPDPDEQWLDKGVALEDLKRASNALFEGYNDAVQVIDDESMQTVLSGRVAVELMCAAAVFGAARAPSKALELLEKAETMSGPGEVLEEAQAARRDLPNFVLLFFGRWNMRQGLFDFGDAALKTAAKNATDPVLIKAAKKARNVPRPMNGAPTMFTYNGIGTNLYGKRDPDHESGSHIATLCFCLLFIPVIPIAAYRVIEHGDDSYSFLAKERLSSFAKGALVAVVLAIVGGIGYNAISSSLNAPDRLARIALEDVEAAGVTGPDAIASYQDWFQRHAESAPDAELQRAELAVAKLLTASVEPSVERVGSLLTAQERFYAVTGSSDGVPDYVANVYADAADGWLTTLGSKDSASTRRCSSLNITPSSQERPESASRAG